MNTSTPCRTITPERAATWWPIFQKFFELLDRYETLGKFSDETDEVGYWCGERALVGVLASAVACLDGAALVEFEARDRTEKRRVPDLWFRLPGNGEESWIVEAKFDYAPAVPDLPLLVSELHCEANHQLKRLRSDGSRQRRAAVIFICPTRAGFDEWRAAFESLVSGGRADSSVPRTTAAALYERKCRKPAKWRGIPHPGLMTFVFEVVA